MLQSNSENIMLENLLPFLVTAWEAEGNPVSLDIHLQLRRLAKNIPPDQPLETFKTILAPLLVKEIFEIIQRINHEEKTTILLVEQNARVALSIANYGYVMENGRVVLDGPAEKLSSNEDVQEFYLGIKQSTSTKGYRRYKRRRRWG